MFLLPYSYVIWKDKRSCHAKPIDWVARRYFGCRTRLVEEGRSKIRSKPVESELLSTFDLFLPSNIYTPIFRFLIFTYLLGKYRNQKTAKMNDWSISHRLLLSHRFHRLPVCVCAKSDRSSIYDGIQ